jgi:hypothetical protein
VIVIASFFYLIAYADESLPKYWKWSELKLMP